MANIKKPPLNPIAEKVETYFSRWDEKICNWNFGLGRCKPLFHISGDGAKKNENFIKIFTGKDHVVGFLIKKKDKVCNPLPLPPFFRSK